MNQKIKGKYLVLGGILWFVIAKIISANFPGLISQAIGTIAELTWPIIVGIGIIVWIRDSKSKK